MSGRIRNHQPDPESGIPAVERALLGSVLKISSTLIGPRTHLKLFAREANRILEIVDSYDYDFAGQQAKIPRLLGIEDTSRNWSLYMLLDHLIRVDREILTVIKELNRGYVPHGELQLADFKPDLDCGAETIEAFQETARTFQSDVHGLLPLRTTARFAHPWFGPLDARGWTALAAAHHRIHRRQARKIVAVLGVT